MSWALWASCVLAAQQAARDEVADVKRIYIEPFSLKDGSKTLRQDLIAQIRKQTSIAVVSERSLADAVLSGTGEIWVKGYFSLNPRSGRSPSNGTPVYSGYLSVELKDTRGETLWSYLETPKSGSENIAKTLASGIAKRLAAAIKSSSN